MYNALFGKIMKSLITFLTKTTIDVIIPLHRVSTAKRHDTLKNINETRLIFISHIVPRSNNFIAPPKIHPSYDLSYLSCFGATTSLPQSMIYMFQSREFFSTVSYPRSKPTGTATSEGARKARLKRNIPIQRVFQFVSTSSL